MAVINDPNTAANIVQVGPVSTASTQNTAHVGLYPIPHGSLGHYRSSVRFSVIASQAAASRIWEVRNTSTNLLIPTRMRVLYMQITAGATANYGRVSLQLFRDTTFTAVDTTNTVTPTASLKRTGMGASPGNAAIRHVTVAGATAGMTGGTRTPDGGVFCQFEGFNFLTLPTQPMPYYGGEVFDDVNGTHPFVIAQNEGIEMQIDMTGTIANFGPMSVVVDFSWAEVTAF